MIFRTAEEVQQAKKEHLKRTKILCKSEFCSKKLEMGQCLSIVKMNFNINQQRLTFAVDFGEYDENSVFIR